MWNSSLPANARTLLQSRIKWLTDQSWLNFMGISWFRNRDQWESISSAVLKIKATDPTPDSLTSATCVQCEPVKKTGHQWLTCQFCCSLVTPSWSGVLVRHRVCLWHAHKWCGAGRFAVNFLFHGAQSCVFWLEVIKPSMAQIQPEWKFRQSVLNNKQILDQI